MLLGKPAVRSAVAPLVERLSDKKDSVRGAAAVALGRNRRRHSGDLPGCSFEPASGTAAEQRKAKRANQNRIHLS